MGPIDYTINAANPLQAMLGGLQGGLQIQGLQQQNEQRAMLAEAQAAKLAAEQQKAQLESEELSRQQQYMNELDALRAGDFNADRLLSLSMVMPKDTAKAMQEGVAAMTGEQQRNALGEMTNVMSSLTAGKLDVAREQIKTKAEAYRNSGNAQGAQQMDAMLAGLEDNDASDVIIGIGSIMSQFPNGPEALKAIQEVRGSGAVIRKGEAEATTAEVAAKYAEKERLRDLEKKGWDIAALKNDITLSKEDQRIRAMEAETARMNAGAQRDALLLRIQDARTNYDNKVADRLAEAESGQYGILSVRQAVDDLMNHAGFTSLFGAKMPYAASIPGSDTAGSSALLDQLKAKVFVIGAQKMKGLGALGEKEGAKIEAEVAALNPNMNEKDAKAALGRIQQSMSVLDKMHQKRYGVPPADSFKDLGTEPTVDTADEYNALPSGAVYVDKADGKKYRKP